MFYAVKTVQWYKMHRVHSRNATKYICATVGSPLCWRRQCWLPTPGGFIVWLDPTSSSKDTATNQLVYQHEDIDKEENDNEDNDNNNHEANANHLIGSKVLLKQHILPVHQHEDREDKNKDNNKEADV